MRHAFWTLLVCMLASMTALAQTTGPAKSAADYRVEWVGLIAQYELLLERAAGKLTEKYREPLSIAPGAVVSADNWLKSGEPLLFTVPNAKIPMQLGGEEVIVDAQIQGSIPHSVKVQEARNEMLAIRDRLDAKFQQAYSNWRDATLRSDTSAVVALWDARRELAAVAATRDQAWTGIGMPYVRKQLVGQIEGAVAKNMIQVPILGLRLNTHMDNLVGPEWRDWLTSKSADFLKETFAARFDKALEKPDKAACTALAESIAVMADKELLDQAYNLRRGNPKPVMYAAIAPGEKNPNISDRYYAYGSVNTRKEHYNTSIGLLIAQRDVIGAKIEGWLWNNMNTLDPGAQLNVRGADAIRACENEKAIEFQRNGIWYSSGPPGAGVGNFPVLREKYATMKRELEDDAKPCVQPWFDALAAGTTAQASPDDKLHALAAVRLLKADLVYFMANNFDRQVRDWAIGKLADQIGESSAAQALLGPLHSVLSDAVKEYAKSAIESGVDRFAPDQVKALSGRLDDASIAIAGNLGINSRIERVLGSATDIEAMITSPKELPPAFGGSEVAGKAKVELKGEPGVYAMTVLRIDNRFTPAQTTPQTKYVMVRNGQTLQEAVDARLAELQKAEGNQITIKFQSVRRQSATGGGQ